jgi:hypothetical protein
MNAMSILAAVLIEGNVDIPNKNCLCEILKANVK